jgi:DNA-binding IscR family transcriptional regulator
VVLIIIGGCQLLDGLVVVSVEARMKIVRCFGEELCEAHCARPAGAVKSNSSKARREGRQVVRPGQMLELVVSTPRGRV